MEIVCLEEENIDLRKLDTMIREKIPSGFSVRNEPHPLLREINLEELRCIKDVNLERARCSIGTLGGGNHFIEWAVTTKGSSIWSFTPEVAISVTRSRSTISRKR